MAYENDGYKDDQWEILPNFRFIIRVEGYFDVALKAIRPFTKENEYEQIEEGGMNDFVHMKRKHVTKPHTIQVERYLTEDFYDPMPNGTAFVLPLLLFVGPNNADSFAWAPRRTYCFFGAQVLNKEIGGFDAEKSGLLTETITIAYHQMYMMDTPFDLEESKWDFSYGISNKFANQGYFSLDKNKKTKKEFEDAAALNLWKFAADGEYLGNGVTWSGSFKPTLEENKMNRTSFESKAKKNAWTFPEHPESDYVGKGVRWSGAPDQNIKQNKVTKEQFEAKSKKNTWHFTADENYLGNGTQYSGAPDQQIPQNKLSKKAFEDKANQDMWQFSDNNEFTGNGKMKAAHNQDETERDVLEARARQRTWPKESYANTLNLGGESKEDFLKR